MKRYAWLLLLTALVGPGCMGLDKPSWEHEMQAKPPTPAPAPAPAPPPPLLTVNDVTETNTAQIAEKLNAELSVDERESAAPAAPVQRLPRE